MSKKNYRDKKELFTALKNLTITVPSEWMKNQLSQSFVSEYPIEVVRNGIDINRFNYERTDISIGQVKEKYGIPSDKKVLIAVASVWDDRKGLSDLLHLSAFLPDEYIILIVGLKRSRFSKISTNIIPIQRTEDKDELVALYCMADILINPSREESFSLVTIEAHACGVPTIVLGGTAVAELVSETNGVVLNNHESEDYLQAIKRIEEKGFDRAGIRNTILQYDENNMTMGMMKIYNS